MQHKTHPKPHQPPKKARKPKPWAKRKGKHSWLFYGISFAAILLLSGTVGILAWHSHRQNDQETKKLTEEQEKGAHVVVSLAELSQPTREIELIGEARPFFSTKIFARVSGYLTDLWVDKGDHVHLGDKIAHIDSPEVNKAYLAALADYRNKSRIAARIRILRAKKLISQQEADQAFAVSDIAKASVETEKVLQSYQTVYAPFEGTITARYVDPGSLIQNASQSDSSAQVLVSLSETDKLRIYVYVDQKDAPYVHADDPADIWLSEDQSFHIHAHVSRVSGELDPKTRTLLTEIDVENPSQQLVSGSFVKVRLQVKSPQFVEIPVKALFSDYEKPTVAVVDAGNHIHFKKVEISENDGQIIRLASGIEAGEKVVVDLGSSARDGTEVQPITKNAADSRQQAGQKSQAGAEPSPGPSSTPSP